MTSPVTCNTDHRGQLFRLDIAEDCDVLIFPGLSKLLPIQ
jgi:hypothetical protein